MEFVNTKAVPTEPPEIQTLQKLPGFLNKINNESNNNENNCCIRGSLRQCRQSKPYHFSARILKTLSETWRDLLSVRVQRISIR